MQRDFERQVRVLPAHGLHLGHDGVQRFLGRVDVDIVLHGQVRSWRHVPQPHRAVVAACGELASIGRKCHR